MLALLIVTKKPWTAGHAESPAHKFLEFYQFSELRMNILILLPSLHITQWIKKLWSLSEAQMEPIS
jgi:hypothetical protein